MNNLKLLKLKNELNEKDGDYWYDEGCCIARNLLDEGGIDLLNEIVSIWQEWSENCQEHLAYILGEGDSEVEISLIYELLDSPYESVVYRAKEAIYELESKT